MRRFPLSRALLGLMASSLVLAISTYGIAGGIKNPIKKPKFDATAESVELFSAMDSGQLKVTMISKNEFEANIFIENKTKKPLTVKLPKTAVGVQVLKQGFGPAAGAGAAGGANNQAGSQQGNGQAQQQGGGMGMMGGMGMGGMQGMGGMGMGMFSVPPEKTVLVPFTSVCLNHGKPTPKPSMTYKLVPTESYTQDPVLQEMLVQVATGKLDRGAAQAATWHITDKMSWEQLAAKTEVVLGGQGGTRPYFTRQQIIDAMSLFSAAKQQAEIRAKETPKSKEPKRAETKL